MPGWNPGMAVGTKAWHAGSATFGVSAAHDPGPLSKVPPPPQGTSPSQGRSAPRVLSWDRCPGQSPLSFELTGGAGISALGTGVCQERENKAGVWTKLVPPLVKLRGST